ncbi:uncharacterized protein MONBRDRAFT_23654 [Monosiga brevicollis MX1]|uniref:Uncharacterized protein n=1 Tax=Monosiga brevicollis TaxID=81824 RepID=A9UU30_MONBE|nr:uncharacterized protein MONBRDRAFT_23654 [Monosiga brevicollis MX1]EDQ91595.1 predicted protein [Monosiga brevicollis MX1]|eukprot:XP_001744017.1 hypothetical protein [Monosiga brevicollis MX1]
MQKKLDFDDEHKGKFKRYLAFFIEYLSDIEQVFKDQEDILTRPNIGYSLALTVLATCATAYYHGTDEVAKLGLKAVYAALAQIFGINFYGGIAGCYLESTNLKSTAESSAVAVKVCIDKITRACVLTGDGDPTQEAVSFFVTDDDSTHPPQQVIINGAPNEPLERLNVEVEGIGGLALQSDSFMVLRFECD